MVLFLKNLAINVREKQEKSVVQGESIIKFPQIFFQA